MKRTFRIFSGFFLGFSFGVSLLLLFQYLADPYSYFGVKKIPGLNAKKPFLHRKIRLVKPRIIEKLRPQVIILGASNVEGGLNPNHHFFSEPSRVFNAGLPGGRFYESYKLFQHALVKSDIKQVIVSLDFIIWAGRDDITLDPFPEALLSSNASAASNSFASISLLSRHFYPENLAHGLSTLGRQDSSSIIFLKGRIFPHTWYLENGQRMHNSPLRLAKYKGADRRFRGLMRKHKRRLSSIPKANFFPARVAGDDYFSLLKSFSDLALENNVELIFMIPPCHVTMLETYLAAGVWPEYSLFKRRIKSQLDLAEAGASRKTPVYDFCTYNEYNNEPIFTRPEPASPVSSFWDSMHFNTVMGDRALSVIAGDVASDDGFGSDLRDVHSISEYMNIDLLRRVKYRSQYIEEFTVYDRILSK